MVKDYVQSGRVLDVGCVDARTTNENSRERVLRKPDALFRTIAEANPETVGLDIDAEGVAALNDLGYSAHYGDAETVDLQQTFNTVIAGEIIEHLENPGLFLRNMHRHLKPGGILILSTPNPFYNGQTWKIWRYGRPSVHEDHLSWQDPTTLTTLLCRTGFQVEQGYWVQPPRSLWKSWKNLFRRYFAHSFLIVAQRCESQSCAAA